MNEIIKITEVDGEQSVLLAELLNELIHDLRPSLLGDIEIEDDVISCGGASFDDVDILNMIIEYSSKYHTKKMLPLLDIIYHLVPYLCEAIRADIYYWSRVYTETKDITRTYLVYDELSKFTKIGRSNDPYQRFNILKCSNPRIKLLAIADTDIELNLHTMFKDKLVKGEWYNLSNEDINKIIEDFKFKKVK